MGAETASTLAASLLADQRARWVRGERVRVEEFLNTHPGLRENSELLLDLIYAETILRSERGETPTVDEYVHRFPDLADPIRTQFEVDAAIGADATQITEFGSSNRLIESAPTQVGRFEIQRELGRGGFGIVYLARDPQLGRYVALKVPRADVVHSAQLRERFQQEARAAAGLDHPNLVPVYEAGEIGSLCYIVSAFCPGINLADWMRQRKEPVSFAEAAGLVKSLADGVQHSHSKGILHRDLKPANVMLVATESAPGPGTNLQTDTAVKSPTATHRAVLNAYLPKITDFGLAKLSGAEVNTQTGVALGTPAYMAPEQAGAKKAAVGPAADVYSLGVILYELVTGRTPFVADSPVEILLAAQKDEPLPPSRLRQRLPRDLETICLKCLEKEPNRRYATAGALADDLGRFLNGDAILARPVGTIGRGVRWARRHRAITALLAILMLSLATGVSGISWQWWRAERHATQASHDRDVALQAQKKEAEALDRHRIMRAHDEWLSDNTQAARDLLRDAAARRDTWEYRYVSRLCNLGLFVDEHQAPVIGVAYTPDGQSLLSANRDGVLLVRDLASGKAETRAILPNRATNASRMALNPADGRYMAVSTAAGMVHVWDRNDWTVASWKAHDPAAYVLVTYSPRGHYLATAAGDSVKVWNADHKEVYTFRNTHRVTDVCWSPDERFLAVSAYDMPRVRIWEVSTGQETTIRTIQWNATAVAFSPDGKHFAWTGMDGVVPVYDVQANFKQVATLAGAPGIQSRLSFSPDGRMIVSASRFGPARIWRVESGQLVSTIHGHSNGVRDLVFTPDGSVLTTVGGDQRIIAWDMLDYQDVTTLVDWSPQPLHAAAFSADGRHLVTATFNFRLWDLDRRAAMFSPTPPFTRSLSVAFHPTGEQFAGGDDKGNVRVFDQAGKQTAIQQMTGYPLALTYTDGGRRLLVAGWDNALFSWASASDRAPERILGPLGNKERKRNLQDNCRAVFSADGSRLAYCERGQAPTVWDLHTRQTVVVLENAPSSVTAMTFDRDGERLALGSRGGEIQIRHARTGELIATLLGHPMEITGLAFTPDGSRLASAATDGVVKLWDPVNAVEVLSLRGHATFDTALAFSPDGERLLAAGWDGFLRLWSIRDPHAESAEVRLERRRAWHASSANNSLTRMRWYAAVHHLSELVLLQKDRWQHWYDRGGALAELGEWDRATQDLEKAMEHPDCSEMPFYERAHLYLRAHDFENYARLCRRLQNQFGSNETLSTTNSLLWISVLHPSARSLAEELVAKGDAALARAKPGQRDELLNTVAALRYRAGHDEEAIRLLDRSVTNHGKGGTFDDWIFLALAHHRQGRREKAREYYDRATEEVKKVRAGASFSNGRAARWDLLVEMETLYEEVKNVMGAAK